MHTKKPTTIGILIIFGLILLGGLGLAIYQTKQAQNTNSSAAPSTCSTTIYNTDVLSDHPIAYWPLDDTEATIRDCSTTATHTGNAINSPAITTLPNGENSRVFNGSTQYIEFNDMDDLSVPKTGIITIEAWMRPDILQFTRQESTGYVHWFGKGTIGGSNGNHEYTGRIYSLTNSENRPNRISGYAFNPQGGLGTGSYFQDAVSTGQWIHYALVINTVEKNSQYPTGYTKIYKNGIARDQDPLSEYSIIPVAGNAPLRFGTRDFNSFFQGAIGKIAIYNYEVPANRLLSHYQKMTTILPTQSPASPTPTNTPTPIPSNTSTPTSIATPKPTNTPIPTFSGTTIKLKSLLDGIGSRGDNTNSNGNGSNKNPIHQERKISIDIFNASNQLITTSTSNMKYNSSNGSFEAIFTVDQSVTTGNYTIKATTDNHLTRLLPGIQSLTAGQSNELPNVTFVAGDIENNNKLDILDYNILIGCYSDLLSAISCNDTQKTASDLNDDGAVNQFDYNLLLRELSIQPGQ